eukprot:5308638-Prymnesium_polylepis.2
MSRTGVCPQPGAVPDPVTVRDHSLETESTDVTTERQLASIARRHPAPLPRKFKRARMTKDASRCPTRASVAPTASRDRRTTDVATSSRAAA